MVNHASMKQRLARDKARPASLNRSRLRWKPRRDVPTARLVCTGGGTLGATRSAQACASGNAAGSESSSNWFKATCGANRAADECLRAEPYAGFQNAAGKLFRTPWSQIHKKAPRAPGRAAETSQDRKSTRLNSSH